VRKAKTKLFGAQLLLYHRMVKRVVVFRSFLNQSVVGFGEDLVPAWRIQRLFDMIILKVQVREHVSFMIYKLTTFYVRVFL
jgi:hypothetical protein